MILTLTEDKRKIVSTKLLPKDGMLDQIKYLHHLYSKPDFEYGYLQHGPILFTAERPEEELVTENHIQVFDKHRWGPNGIENIYPIEYFTTRARNTLIITRQILGLGHYNTNFALKSFFKDSFKEIDVSGLLINSEFNLLMQIKKLEYILENKELALPLLKDAYLDFRLFVSLLIKVDIESKRIMPEEMFEDFVEEAEENTQILALARKFTELEHQ